jgi:gliding motility-associated-like protein
MKKFLLAILSIFGWLSSYTQVVLITDGTWKGVGNSALSGGTAWLYQGYDDSTWPYVEAPNAANVIPVVPGSLSIWVLPYSDTAKMRKTFVVPVGDSYSGSISINADNEFELYFNGVSQGFYNNWMGGPYVFDISPGLQGCVQNVIAINGANWGGPYGASLNTTLDVTNPLNTPVAQLATNVSCSGFTANWDSVPTADLYLLDISTDPTFATFYSVYHDYNMGSSLNEILTGLPPGISYYYRLRCKRTNALGTLTSCYSNTIQVDLDNPTVSYTAPDSLCAGETIDLQLSAVSGGAYGWTGPNGFSDPDSVASITNTSALNSGDYIYTVQYPGCPVISDTISIVVVDDPPLTITPAGPYCSTGTMDTLIANGTNLQWSGIGIVNGTMGIFDPGAAGGGPHTITVTSNNYCPDTATASVTVNINGGYTVSGSDTLCEGGTINLQSTSGAGAIISWIGPNGFVSANNNNTITQSSNINSGLYFLTVTYPACPVVQDTLPVAVLSFPNPTITPAGPFCSSDPTQLLAANPSGGNWLGTGITNSSSGSFDPVTAGNGAHTILYILTGQCPDSASMVINVSNSVPLSSVVFPNVFTPNNDAQNDLYAPQVPTGGHYKLVIFDRWGVQVFQADPDMGWNGEIGGTFANEGIYYWICEITSDCSSSPLIEKGFLQLFKP